MREPSVAREQGFPLAPVVHNLSLFPPRRPLPLACTLLRPLHPSTSSILASSLPTFFLLPDADAALPSRRFESRPVDPAVLLLLARRLCTHVERKLNDWGSEKLRESRSLPSRKSAKCRKSGSAQTEVASLLSSSPLARFLGTSTRGRSKGERFKVTDRLSLNLNVLEAKHWKIGPHSLVRLLLNLAPLAR